MLSQKLYNISGLDDCSDEDFANLLQMFKDIDKEKQASEQI